jgi:hypothetical protein
MLLLKQRAINRLYLKRKQKVKILSKLWPFVFYRMQPDDGCLLQPKHVAAALLITILSFDFLLSFEYSAWWEFTSAETSVFLNLLTHWRRAT